MKLQKLLSATGLALGGVLAFVLPTLAATSSVEDEVAYAQTITRPLLDQGVQGGTSIATNMLPTYAMFLVIFVILSLVGVALYKFTHVFDFLHRRHG